MKSYRIHRVIVEDTKNSIYSGFLTYETIYEYFIANYYSDMIAFHIKIDFLNIKTKCNITISKDETIYNSLLKFWNHKISILPILNSDKESISQPQNHKDESLFAFLFLKDIVYFFSNGEKFSVKTFIFYNIV